MATNSYSVHGGQGRRTERWDAPRKSKLEIAEEIRQRRNADLLRLGSDESRVNSYLQHLEEQKAKKVQQGLMNLEALKEAGATTRTGMEQEGQTTRTGMTTDLGRERLGFDKESSLRDYGLRSDNQDYTQTMGLMDYSRQGKYADRSFDFDKEKFKYLQGIDDRKLTDEERKNRFNEYKTLAGLGQDSSGLGLTEVPQETLFNRMNQAAAYTGGQHNPNFASSSTWTPEEMDFMDQINKSVQTTGLQAVGNNQPKQSYTMQQKYSMNRPDNPSYIPPSRGPAPQGPGASNLGTHPFSYEDAEVRKRRNLDKNYAGNYGRTL